MAILERLKGIYSDIWDFLNQTKAEVAIGVIAAAIIAAPVSIRHEINRPKQIPLAFTEQHQLEREALVKGEELNNITKLLCFSQDGPMKIFESYNDSYDITGIGRSQAENFAIQLEKHLDPEHKYHKYNLNDIFTGLPSFAKIQRNILQDFYIALRDVSLSHDAFRRTWDYDKDEHGHYETRVTGTDEDGNQETEEVWVVDYYTHTYTYFPEHGNRASSTLDNMLKVVPELKFTDKVALTTKTNLEGERAAKGSRKLKEGEVLASQDLIRIANTYFYGSTLLLDIPQMQSSYKGVVSIAAKWRVDKNTAKSISYDSHSSWGDDPKEYDTVEAAMSETSTFVDRSTPGLKTLDTIVEKAPGILQKVNDIISIYHGKKQGDLAKEEKQLLRMTQDLYSEVFKQGVDVYVFRAYMPVLWTLLAMAVGGGLGYLWDMGNTALYRRKREDESDSEIITPSRQNSSYDPRRFPGRNTF
jgi:hypothetical protein